MKKVFDAIRDSVKAFLKTGNIVPLDINRSWLGESRGVFVTFKDKSGLRGSMGFLDTDKPLKLAINDCAIAAATDDPRYRSLSYDEVDNARLEVCIIDDIYPENKLKDFIIGFHGIYIESDINAGVLQPQEILEQKLDLKDAIDYARIKAGILHSEDVKRVYIFEANVYYQDKRGESVHNLTNKILKDHKKEKKKNLIASILFGGSNEDN